METIVGFVAGYLVGSREGKAALDRARTSLDAIKNSPEAPRLAADAVTVAGSVLRRVSARGLGQTVSGVTELLVRGATAAMGTPREESRAS